MYDIFVFAMPKDSNKGRAGKSANNKKPFYPGKILFGPGDNRPGTDMLEVLGARVTDRYREYSEWKKKNNQFIGRNNAEQAWYDAARAYEVVEQGCLNSERCSDVEDTLCDECDNPVMNCTRTKFTSCTPEAKALMGVKCGIHLDEDENDPDWNVCQVCFSLGGGIDVGSKKKRGVNDTQCIHCEATLMCLECGNWSVFEAGEDCCKYCVDEY